MEKQTPCIEVAKYKSLNAELYKTRGIADTVLGCQVARSLLAEAIFQVVELPTRTPDFQEKHKFRK